MRTAMTRSVSIGSIVLCCVAVAATAQDRDRDRGRDRDRDAGDEPLVEPEERAFSPERLKVDPRSVPPRPDRPDRDGRWFLGVAVDYREYGAVITGVTRRSPAERARLEPGDVIVTVRGYQIGIVANRLYPLDRELDLRADRRGQVPLLVQDHRTSQLTTIPVRLEPAHRPDPPRAASLIGTVTTRRGGQLPRGAVLTIRLVDVTDPRSALTPITQRRYQDPGPVPIPFELEYDPDEVRPGRTYALQAAVTVNGIPAYQTKERYEAFRDGRPRRVDMVLDSAR